MVCAVYFIIYRLKSNIVRNPFAGTMKLSFETDPSQYRHWTLAVDGEIARLIMKVTPFGGANTELELKSNSYDLSVDLELAHAIQRLPFTPPPVKRCVITSLHH